MNDETSLSPLLFPKTSGTFGLTKNQCKKSIKVKHVRCDMKFFNHLFNIRLTFRFKMVVSKITKV